MFSCDDRPRGPIAAMRITLILLGVFFSGCGVAVSGDAGDDSAPTEGGDEGCGSACGEELLFFSPGDACYVPADCCDPAADFGAHCEQAFPGHPVPVMCCDVGSDGLAAICAEYFPDLPTPVMCDVGTLPAGYACASPTSQDFDCGWRASRLLCCRVH